MNEEFQFPREKEKHISDILDNSIFSPSFNRIIKRYNCPTPLLPAHLTSGITQITRVLRLNGLTAKRREGAKSNYKSKYSPGERIVFKLFLVTFISITLVTIFSTPARGTNSLFFSYSKESVFTRLDFNGFGLGVFKNDENLIQTGLSLKKIKVGGGKWKVSPFLSGGFSFSEGLVLEETVGGAKLEYLDYQIGGWLFSVDTCIWTDLADYRTWGVGSYSIGNVEMNFGFTLSTEKMRNSDLWYPRINTNYWDKLLGVSFLSPSNFGSDYLVLTGAKKLFPSGPGIKWSQGLYFDLEEKGGSSPCLIGNVSWNNNNLSAIIKNLRILGFLGYFRLDSLGLGGGVMGRFDETFRYGVLLDYSTEQYYGIEVLTAAGSSNFTINLFSRW